ncbi:MAG TPA: AMP-binding protein [Acidimicrobiia bacterium]|nr:AMP-binding protein [Acidimicrobiia bacterium]
MHVIDLFDAGARNHSDRLAFSGAGGDMTYREVWEASNRLARALLVDGFQMGFRFAGLSPNCSPVLLSMLGAMRAGGAWCNLNLRAALDANVDVLARGRCEVLFFHSSVADMVPAFTGNIPTLRRVVCLDSDKTGHPSMADWIADHDGGFLDHPIDPLAVGFQGSTGGTTGAPKLIQGTNEWLLMSTLGWATCWRFDTPPVNVAMTPVTHAAGAIALAQLQFGGTVIFMDHPDVGELLRLIETRRVSILFLPPTLIYLLLAHPDLDRTDTSSLRYLISAAAPISPDKMAEGVERLGPVMCQAYGQTEAGFPLTWMSPTEVAEAVADPAKRYLLLSAGRPTLICPAMEAMADDGTILPPGETGEIVMRGRTAMREYLDDPAATAEAQAHGWHHTGDIGHRDADGYLFITDRKRDMIVSGGFNIFPFEIEQVLFAHPAVQDCAVIGVPDGKWGEAVKACVQLKPGAEVSEAELIAACRESLGSMKAPKSVDFIGDLPRSPVGKVLKRELRAPYWDGHDRQVG